MSTVKIGYVSSHRLVAHLEGQEKELVLGGSREGVVGVLVRFFPDRFGLDPKLFNLERPAKDIGAIVLTNPEAFGVTIVEEKKKE